MLVITGDGLKTLDAVRGTFETETIEPTVDAFDERFEGEPLGRRVRLISV